VYGTVTDAYNPGKGFAFVTYTKPGEAKAAVDALDQQEVCGNTVSVSIAKPKGGEAGTPRGGGRGGAGGGGGGRRQEVEGAKLFVHNVSEETPTDDLYAAFGEHGTVTDAYNPGRGFAFITFASAAEANTAIEAMEGQEVCGRTIQCNIAKPREDKNGGELPFSLSRLLLASFSPSSLSFSGGGGRGGGGRGGGDRGRGGGRGRGAPRGRGMSISAGGGGGGANKKMSFD
jgi:RNA recognition motif-containing protein